MPCSSKAWHRQIDSGQRVVRGMKRVSKEEGEQKGRRICIRWDWRILFYYRTQYQWSIYPNAMKGREMENWLRNCFCCRRVTVEVAVTLASCDLLHICVCVRWLSVCKETIAGRMPVGMPEVWFQWGVGRCDVHGDLPQLFCGERSCTRRFTATVQVNYAMLQPIQQKVSAPACN